MNDPHYMHGQVTAIDYFEDEQVLLAGEANLLHIYTNVLKPDRSEHARQTLQVFFSGVGSIHLIRHSNKKWTDAKLTCRQVLCACGSEVVCFWLAVDNSTRMVQLNSIQRGLRTQDCRLLTGVFVPNTAVGNSMHSPSENAACEQNSAEHAVFVDVHGQIMLFEHSVPMFTGLQPSINCLNCLAKSDSEDHQPQTLACGPKRLLYSGCLVKTADLDINVEIRIRRRNFLLIAGTAFGELLLWHVCVKTEDDMYATTLDERSNFTVTSNVIYCLPGAHSGEIFDIVPYWPTTHRRWVTLATVSGDRCAKLWRLKIDGLEDKDCAGASSCSLLTLLAVFGGAGAHSKHNSRLWRCAFSGPHYLVCVGEDACCSVWCVAPHLLNNDADVEMPSEVLHACQPVEQMKNLHSAINIWSVVAVEMSHSKKLVVFTGGHDGAVWLTTLDLSILPNSSFESTSLMHRADRPSRNAPQAKLLAFMPETTTADENACIILSKQGCFYYAVYPPQCRSNNAPPMLTHLRVRAANDRKLVEDLRTVFHLNLITSLLTSPTTGTILFCARNAVYALGLETIKTALPDDLKPPYLICLDVCYIESTPVPIHIRTLKYAASRSGTEHYIVSSFDGKMYWLKFDVVAGKFHPHCERINLSNLPFPTSSVLCNSSRRSVGADSLLMTACCTNLGTPTDSAATTNDETGWLTVLGTSIGSLILLEFSNGTTATVKDSVYRFHWPREMDLVAGCPVSDSMIESSSSGGKGGVCDMLHPVPEYLRCDSRRNAEALHDASQHDGARQFFTLGRDDGVMAHWLVVDDDNSTALPSETGRRCLTLKLLQIYNISCCKTLLSFIVPPPVKQHDESSSLLLALGFRANQLVIVDVLNDSCLVALDGVGGPNRCLDSKVYSRTPDSVDVAFTFGDAFVWHAMPLSRQQRRCLAKPLHGHEINAVACVRNNVMPNSNEYFLTASEDCCLKVCHIPPPRANESKHVHVLATLRGHLSSVRCVKALQLSFTKFVSAICGRQRTRANPVSIEDDELLTLVVSGGGRCQLKAWLIFGLEARQKKNKTHDAVLCAQLAAFMPLPLVKKRWHESTDVALDSDKRIMDCDVFVVRGGNEMPNNNETDCSLILVAAACSDGGFMLFRLLYTISNDEESNLTNADKLRLRLCSGGRPCDDFRLQCGYSSSGKLVASTQSEDALLVAKQRNCCLQRIRIVSATLLNDIFVLMNIVTTGTDGVIELLRVKMRLDGNRFKADEAAGDFQNFQSTQSRSLCRLQAHQSGISAFDFTEPQLDHVDRSPPAWFVSGGDDGCLYVGIVRYEEHVKDHKALQNKPALEVCCSKRNASLSKISGVKWLTPAAPKNVSQTSDAHDTLIFAAVTQQQECAVWSVNVNSGVLETLHRFTLQTADINAFDVSTVQTDSENDNLSRNLIFGGRGLEIHSVALPK